MNCTSTKTSHHTILKQLDLHLLINMTTYLIAICLRSLKVTRVSVVSSPRLKQQLHEHVNACLILNSLCDHVTLPSNDQND